MICIYVLISHDLQVVVYKMLWLFVSPDGCVSLAFFTACVPGRAESRQSGESETLLGCDCLCQCCWLRPGHFPRIILLLFYIHHCH